MKLFLRTIVTALALIVLLVLGAIFAHAMYRTHLTARGELFERFSGGNVPTALPTGTWDGYAYELDGVSWKGKKFLGDGRGINVFYKGGVLQEAYPFTVQETASVGWKGKRVLTLDYNQKGNPLWLRFITDEMVLVEKGEYLGVVYIRLIPWYPFRMGYFRLRQ